MDERAAARDGVVTFWARACLDQRAAARDAPSLSQWLADRTRPSRPPVTCLFGWQALRGDVRFLDDLALYYPSRPPKTVSLRCTRTRKHLRSATPQRRGDQLLNSSLHGKIGSRGHVDVR